MVFMTIIQIETQMLNVLNHLSEITDDMLRVASGAGSNVGTGGMQSKLIAARTALQAGVKVFIGQGVGPSKLVTIIRR